MTMPGVWPAWRRPLIASTARFHMSLVMIWPGCTWLSCCGISPPSSLQVRTFSCEVREIPVVDVVARLAAVRAVPAGKCKIGLGRLGQLQNRLTVFPHQIQPDHDIAARVDRRE